MMKRFVLKTLKDALLTWVALAVGITVTSILYSILNVAGLSENTSLLIAFIALIGLIISGLLLAPQSLFNLGGRTLAESRMLQPIKEREGTLIENRIVQPTKDTDPDIQPHFISEIRDVIPNVRPRIMLSEHGRTAIALADVADSQVPLIIQDDANLVLSSAELTGLIVGAIIRASAEVVVQGIKSIALTVDRIGTEIEIVTFQGTITRKLKKFEITVAMYSAEKARAENSSYDSQFKQEWLRRIEESFYKQMAGIE